MKRIDQTVAQETRYITLWVCVLSALLQAVFLVIGFWNLTVLWGNLLSGAIAVLNFFLMGLTVQKAVDLEQKQAAARMKLSQTLRNFLLILTVALGFLLPCFNSWAVVIPLFFPRIAIAFRPMFGKENNDRT